MLVDTAERLQTKSADELLARSRGGDADAFCVLLEEHQERLLRQAVGMTGDHQAAEDIVCETMAEAWKSIHRYNDSCRFSTWLFSILLHRFHKYLRNRRSRPVSLCSLPVPPAMETPEAGPVVVNSPEHDLMRKETIDSIRRVLDSMQEKHREVLLMRFFEEASLEEIAQATDCPVGTVKSRLHYALEELRKSRAALNADGCWGDK